MIEEIFSLLWEGITPQRNLDKYCDKLARYQISQKAREELIAEVTRAKILFSKWEFALFTMLLIFAGVYALLSL
jgi:hypothetical protein